MGNLEKTIEKLWACESCHNVVLINRQVSTNEEAEESVSLQYCDSDVCKTMKYFMPISSEKSMGNNEQRGDMVLTCIESSCRKEFIFTKSEQEFYASKSFTTPKRCKECRTMIKSKRLARLNEQLKKDDEKNNSGI